MMQVKSESIGDLVGVAFRDKERARHRVWAARDLHAQLESQLAVATRELSAAEHDLSECESAVTEMWSYFVETRSTGTPAP